jgi:hypothetical protein
MAQIIKHRRGSVTQLKDVTARVGELVMATGSISDMNGPFLFVGETEGVAGAYRPVSKIYQGSSAPTISLGSHGSVIDGTPFYATGNKSLYVLSKDGNDRLDLTGNIEGNLISGVTINSLTGSRATFNTFVSSSALNVSGNTQMGGTLFVDGDTSINADLYITGNTIQTGSIDLTGNVTLGGNIVIGNQTTDLVVFQGEVSSSILPELNNEFDLGSGTQAWRNLHVSGTAYVGILQAESISLSGITVFEDLIVNGDTFLGNDSGDNVYISGSTYVGTLTEKRLTVAGADGLLTDYSGLTFDNGNLNLSGALEVTNIQGTGSLYLKADKNDSRYFEIYNTSTIDTHIKSNGGLSFFGDDTNYLKIDDSLSTITINSVNELSINTTKTTVTGSIYNDQLSYHGVLFAGVDGLIEDDGNFTFNATTLKVGDFEVDVDGDIRTSGSLMVKNGATITGTTTIHGNETVNGILTVTGNTQLGGNLYVSGNLEVLGSATEVHIQSQTIELDDNIIRLNAYSPFERYAGFEVIDSGSSGVSASMVWDSLTDYWMFVSASGQSSKIVGTTAGTYGSEVSLTTNTIPKATGANNIGDSLLTDNGTTLAYNTNKFTVASNDGATLIAGNVTLSYSGGTDSGTLSSTVVFRNSTNVLGYVSSTDTQNVTTQLLGYNNSTGVLEFSSVVDGGSY